MGPARRTALALLAAALCPGCDGALRRSLQGRSAKSHVAVLVHNLDVSGLGSVDAASLKEAIASVIAQATGVPLVDVRAAESQPRSVTLEPGTVRHPWLDSNWPSVSAADGKSTLVTALLYIQDSTAFIAKSALLSQTFQDKFASEMVEHCDASAVAGHIYFDRISVIPDDVVTQRMEQGVEQGMEPMASGAGAEAVWTAARVIPDDVVTQRTEQGVQRGMASGAGAEAVWAGASPEWKDDLDAHVKGGRHVHFNAVGAGWFLVITSLLVILGLGAYQYYKKIQDEKAMSEWRRVGQEPVAGRSFMGLGVPTFLSSMFASRPVGYTGH